MKASTKNILLAALILLPGPGLQGAELSGFADTYHAANLHEDHDVMSSRTRLRLDLDADLDEASLFASLNAVHNDRLEDEEVKLHEAYLDYASGDWGLRVGRQIIVWGNADGVQITDLLCPADMTEFLARDFDDIRMPVTAAKVNWYHEAADFELVWIPVFEPAVMPVGDNPWAVHPPAGPQPAVLEDEEPRRTLGNGELAAKVSFFTSGVDFAFSALSLWDDTPTLHPETGAAGLVLRPRYHRLGVLGGEISCPKGSVVIRGEAAFKHGRHFAVNNVAGEPREEDTLTALVGLDWYPGNDWTLIAQVVDDYVCHHDDELNRDAHQVTGTLNVSKKFLREMLTISNMLYWGITHEELFDRLSAEYALTDDLHLFAGIDGFYGDEDEGVFGPYDDNDQIWLKAKYSF